MLDLLLNFFLAKPTRLITLGHTLVLLSGFFIVLGVVGNAATTSISVVGNLSNNTLPAFTVAHFLPTILSWCVPKSAFGFGIALFLMLAGIVASRAGRTYQRMWR